MVLGEITSFQIFMPERSFQPAHYAFNAEENRGKQFLQVAGAYSKAKGAGVNVSSCCKQIFPPFSLLIRGTV